MVKYLHKGKGKVKIEDQGGKHRGPKGQRN